VELPNETIARMKLPKFKKENKHNNPYLTKTQECLNLFTQAPIALGAAISQNQHTIQFCFLLK